MPISIKTDQNNKWGFLSAALAAEPIFHVAGFPITNAMLNASIALVFFIGVAVMVTWKKSLIPRGIYNAIEALFEFAYNEIQKVTEDTKKTRLFLPLVATIFFFVLFNNWLGLIPGTGSIGFWENVGGEMELIPLLRPATSDLNLTLAIAVLAILSTHVAGVASQGPINYFSKFLNFKGIILSIKKGPMAIMVAIVEFFIGLIEIVGEFAKTLSLSLRLFGNVFAGEVLMTVMLSLARFVVPIPFIFLEILVGVIQATVFAMLTLAFLLVATMGHGEEEHEQKEAHA
ncbi:MAG: FoF1 ATP synthase subunit a [Patescibacteria group bacterium]|jgi:F-type H+-transporting ATPase subunit a